MAGCFRLCCILNVAPVCFNTTYCEEESVSDYLISFDQCCFELSAVSFASAGQCLLCPKTGMYICYYSLVKTDYIYMYKKSHAKTPSV